MTKMMKAAYIQKAGAANTIIFGDVPKPGIGPTKVLVKVKAVAVNHADTHIRAGHSTQETHFPFIIGRDMCGVVEAVGEEVTKFQVGQRVWSNNQGINGKQGTFAEYVSIDEWFLYPLPQNVDDIQAVATLHGASTACHGMIRFAKLREGEILLVHGASGSIGTALVQLAHARGAKVIALTSSPEKMAWCKEQGADVVLNYTKEDSVKTILKSLPNGVDVHWTTSQIPDLEVALATVSKRGRLILMTGYFSHPTLPVGPFYSKECTLLGFTLENASTEDLSGYSTIINRCLSEGILKAKIAQVLPLSEAAKAHELLESNAHLWGRIVLTV